MVMPITLTTSESTPVLEVVVSGKLTHEDFQDLVPEVETMVRRHGKIRVLMDMIDFHGWEVTALWDDARFACQHFRDITRIAMVGDHIWESWMSKFCRPFTAAEVRYFDWHDILKARAWVGASEKEAPHPIALLF